MHPVLIDIGPFTLYTYGAFIALAFMSGLGWSMREARARSLDQVVVQDMAMVSIIGAIAGARILYVLLNIQYFAVHPLDAFKFWNGGLVFQGGAILAVLLNLAYLRRKGERFYQWADVCAPGFALGQAIGRFGCLAAGCCFGAPCDLPWAVTFQDPRSLAPLNLPLHPTQLYHSLAGLLVFCSLLAAKRHLREEGRLAGLFLLLYAIFRFSIEFFRSDYRGELGVLSVTQVIAMAVCVLGVWLMIRKTKRMEICSE